MTNLIVILILTVLMAIYVLWVRPWLRTEPWAQGFFAAIEPIEIALFSKSETILWARWIQLMSLLTVVLGMLGQIDPTPFVQLFPPQYQPFLPMIPGLALTINSFIEVQLRKDVTKSLDRVALPQVVSAQVAEVVAQADSASATASAVIKADAAKA
jgi:hypothetical protein